MTLRNLDLAFAPRSVAVVGASPRPESVGRIVLENILSGGYKGQVYPVNLKYDAVLGQRCYRHVADLPEPPDLAVIVTPPSSIPRLVAALGALGGKAAVVVTAGVGADDGLRQRMLDAARPHLLRIIGPNTIGILNPLIDLNASFVPMAPPPGPLGLISQSGAIVASLVDWAVAEGLGFSQIISLGDMADVDVADCINMLAIDNNTKAILLYLESISGARKFMSAARAAARTKPVIAVKPGRHAAAAKAAQTHTGALAGADRVIDAALRRAGIIRVNDLEDLFNAAEVTGRFAPLRSGRVGIVTNGGGAGVLAVDHLLDERASVATLEPATIEALDQRLPKTWSRANPVDIIGDAPPERYLAAIETVAADPGVDALLVMNCPTALAAPMAAATEIAKMAKGGLVNGKPLLACWLGKYDAEPARVVLEAGGIATFDTPVQAARAVSLLTRWRDLRETLERVPSARTDGTADHNAAAAILAVAEGEGRSLLTEPEAKAVLAEYGVPVPEIAVARDEDEVAAIAGDMLTRYPSVVEKLLSRTITHKSDVGGVVLDLTSREGARDAAVAIRGRIAERHPGEAVDGFTVQPMIERPTAAELIAGIATDPIFGPTILFGAGGTSVEVVDDTATGIVPIDSTLAGDLIDRTRVSRLLAGYRDRAPADREAILRVLTALSQLAVDFPEIVGVDINPLLADANGVVVLDARIQIDAPRGRIGDKEFHLAIRPYPADATTKGQLADLAFTLRPIKPTDAALYPAFLERMDRDDLRLRFLAPVETISHDLLIRLTQLDYDREMAFVAILEPGGELGGIVRYAADPDRQKAEFGILVRSDLKGRGLGTLMMRRLIDHARGEGIGRLEGTVLRENTRMLELCRELGLAFSADESEPTLIRASIDLSLPTR
jgi:acetyltransferase